MYNKEIFMNKNYSNLLMVTILSLTTHSGLIALKRPGKACFDTNKNSWKKAVGKYILGHFAMYCGATATPAGLLKVMGDAPLRHSVGVLKKINGDIYKKFL